jgi:hypothetical protein
VKQFFPGQISSGDRRPGAVTKKALLGAWMYVHIRSSAWMK